MNARLDFVEPLVDTDRLAAWMDAQGLMTGGAIDVERITTGHSNEVFRVTRGWLRRGRFPIHASGCTGSW